MLAFHVNLFAPPAGLIAKRQVALRGESLQRLTTPEGDPPKLIQPLPVSFEEVQRRLGAIPRMDTEPDGYFLVAGEDPQRWQVDGQMFEYNGQMHRIELHGSCPVELFNQLLGCVGWPEIPLVFELVQEGVTLDEANFRRWAAAPVSQ